MTANNSSFHWGKCGNQSQETTTEQCSAPLFILEFLIQNIRNLLSTDSHLNWKPPVLGVHNTAAIRISEALRISASTDI